MIRQANDVPDWLSVSRETLASLEGLLTLVAKWNKSINLVSAESLQDGWKRHILDSAQLMQVTDCDAGKWVDIGSGAGFPGLVVAIISKDVRPNLTVTLVESDRRKATFLSEASRQLGLTVQVICDRVENIPPLRASVVSARAFAPLTKLLGDANRHLLPGGEGLFLKGQSHEAEIAEAKKSWVFNCRVFPSATQSGSAILRVQDIGDTGD